MIALGDPLPEEVEVLPATVAVLRRNYNHYFHVRNTMRIARDPSPTPDVDGPELAWAKGERLMRIAAAPLRLFVFILFMRRRWAARPKRTFADWIALTIARVMSLAVVGGLVYVTYMVEMTGYDDFRKCNKTSTLSRLEWVLGFRPTEDCRSY